MLHIDLLYSYNKARDSAKKIIRKEKHIYSAVLYCIFRAPKSLQMGTAAMKLKDAYSLEGKL